MSTPNNMGFQGSDAPPQAPAPQQAPVSQVTPAPKQGWGTRILGALSGGGKNTNYNVDPNGVMQAVQTPQAPGQMFKNLLGGMLTGLAAGSQSQTGLGGFSAGFQAQQARLQQQDRLKRAQAQQNFKNQEEVNKQKTEALRVQGEYAMSQLEQAKLTFQMANEKTKLSDADQEKHNAYQKAVQETPGGQFEGNYKSSDDFFNSITDPTEKARLIQAKANGEIFPVNTHDQNGNVNGVEIYRLPQKWRDKTRTEPGVLVHDEADPKTGQIKSVNTTIPPGTMTNGEYLDAQAKNLRPLASIQKAQGANETRIIVAGMNNDTSLKKEEMHDQTLEQTLTSRMKAKGQLAPEEVGPTEDMIGTYRLDANLMRYYMKNDPNMAGRIGQKYPGFDMRVYQQSQKAMNSYAAGKDHQSMIAMDTAMQHMAVADAIIQKLPETSNIQDLNRATAFWAKKFGNTEITNYNALQSPISGELGSGFASGKPDKDFVEDLHKNLSTANTPSQLHGVYKTFAHTLQQKMGSSAEQFEKQVPGAANNPYSPNISSGGQGALKHFQLNNPYDFKAQGNGQGGPAGTVGYTSNGTTYHIPKDQVKDFLKDHPKATTI